MQFEIGKIKEYDNLVGKIIAKSDVYLFLKQDLSDINIKIGDIVIFRPEEISMEKKGLSYKKIENIYKKKEERNKIIKKLNEFFND